MNQTNYNIAVIGQTGVGKSSLINYLFGDSVVKTGVGRPVTQNGFHKIKHSIKDMPVTIYDSWGLEVGKEEQWLNELEMELSERDINQPATQWFHSVFYCIAASGGRVQDADIKIIKKFIDEKYKISIVLTKADAISEEDEEQLKETLRIELGNEIAIIAVCSEFKKTRGGQTEPFGKEEVEKQSIIDLIDSLILRIPLHCQKLMENKLNLWCESEINKTKDKKISFKSEKTIINELSVNSEIILKDIIKFGTEIRKQSLECYSFIAEKIEDKLSNRNYESTTFKLHHENKDIKALLYALNTVPITRLAAGLLNIAAGTALTATTTAAAGLGAGALLGTGLLGPLAIPIIAVSSIFLLKDRQKQIEKAISLIDAFKKETLKLIESDTAEFKSSLNAIKKNIITNVEEY